MADSTQQPTVSFFSILVTVAMCGIAWMFGAVLRNDLAQTECKDQLGYDWGEADLQWHQSCTLFNMSQGPDLVVPIAVARRNPLLSNGFAARHGVTLPPDIQNLVNARFAARP